jgi:V/A-type H+-transporting ATPase subunit K
LAKKNATLKKIAKKRNFLLPLIAAVVIPSIVAALFSVGLVAGAAVQLQQNSTTPPDSFLSQYGLSLMAAAVAVAGSCLGAGIAISGAASAGAAAIAERPEASIWVLILAGLGEGVAIYGLLIAILIIGKLPSV